jgi:hypothetical protein
MPINKKMMKDMKERYGEEAGERVYYAVEMKQKKKAKNRKKYGRKD